MTDPEDRHEAQRRQCMYHHCKCHLCYHVQFDYVEGIEDYKEFGTRGSFFCFCSRCQGLSCQSQGCQEYLCPPESRRDQGRLG